MYICIPMPNAHLFFPFKLQPYLYQKWVRKKNNDPSETLEKKATILETDRFILPDAQIGTVKLRVKRKGDLTSEVKASTDGVCAWVNRVWCLVGCGWTFKCFFSALLDEFDEWRLRERIKWVSEMNSTYICLSIYTDIHIQIYIYTYKCIHTHLYIYIYTHIHLYIYTYAYVRHIHVCLYIYIHRYTYT